MDGPTFAVHIALEASGFETAAGGVASSSAAMGTGLAEAGAGVELLQGALTGIVPTLGEVIALINTIEASLGVVAPSLYGLSTSVAALAGIGPEIGAVIGVLEASVPIAGEVGIAFSAMAVSIGETVAALIALIPLVDDAIIALATLAAAAAAAASAAAAAAAAARAEAAAAAAAGSASAAAAADADAAAGSFAALGASMAGIVAAFIAIGGVFLLFSKGVKYGEEAEKVYAQTRATIISTGAAAGYTAQQIADMAKTLGNQAGVDNIEVQKQINYLLTFRRITGDVLPEATRMVLALSRGMSENLRSASIQVGKALEDPIRGVTALRRIGVEFTDGQRELIKHLVQTGDLLGAQKLILRELNIEVGKSADMYAQTFAGQVDIAKTALHEFFRGIGSEVLPALSFLLRDMLGAARGSTSLAQGAATAGHVIGEVLGKSIYYLLAGFHALAAVIDVVFAGIVHSTAWLADGVLAGIQLLQEGLSHIPGSIGERYAKAAKDVQGLRDGAVRDLKTVGDAFWQAAKDEKDAADKADQASRHHKAAIDNVVTGLGKENDELGKVNRAMENYRLQSEKLIEQSKLKLQAAQGTYTATSLGTVALEAQRIATARLAAEEKGRELNAAAASKGLSINPDLPRILGDNAEATERWVISLDKLKTAQQDAESATAGLVAPLTQIHNQLDILQNSRWFTVGIPSATINSSREWGKVLSTVGFGINQLKLDLNGLNSSNPQTIALTKQLADSQVLYQKALRESANQLTVYRAELERPATVAALAAQKEVQLIRDRITATKAGSVALQTYDILLNAHNEALRVEDLLVQQVGESDINYATRRVRVYLEAFGALDTQTAVSRVKTDEFLSSLAGAFDILSTGLGGASTQMGKLAADMGKLVTAIKAVGDAQGTTNKILAAAQVAQGIGAALASLNVGGAGKTGGPQALGGRLDSNYAGIGSLIGTVLGAAIAAYFSGGSATAGGAALGAALGGALGSLISKAGDSASAQLTAGGNVVVGETSRQLNGAVSDALHKIFQGLQAVFASLGLLFQGAPLIDIKVRDNIVRVIVGNVVRTFSTMSDAISFAIAEALKQTATGGHLPPEVLAALKNTTATDMQSLQSDIDFAFSIANVGVPKVVQAIEKSVSDLFVAIQRAASLGIDATKEVEQFTEQIQAQKDSILQTPGKSPADQMRADAAAFNQKMILLKAQETADLADLAIKRTDLQIKLALLQLSGKLSQAQLQQIADAQAALGAIDSAIAAAQGVLAGIVTISDAELAAALARLGRGGKGGGGSASSATQGIQQLIDAVDKLVHQSGMDAFQKQLDDIVAKWHDATAAVHLHANALERAKQARDAAIRAANGNAAAIKAANDAYEKQIKHINKTQAALEAANAARQKEIDLLAKDLQASVKTFVSTGAPGEQVTNALSTIDENAKNLIADARALWKQGGLTTQQLHQMTAAIRAATDAQEDAVKRGVLTSVGKFLGDDGPTGLLAQVRGVSDTAQGLTDNLQALADKGKLTGAELQDLAAKIAAAVPKQQDALIAGADNGLLGELYNLLGMDKENAQLKYDLAVAELRIKEAELAAALQIAHYTEVQMRAILDPLNALIGKVIAAGPSLFESKGSSGGGAVDTRSYAERVAADKAMVAGEGGLKLPSAADAQQSINNYLDLALSPFQRSVKALNAEFDKYRLVLGNTAQVQQAYALALHELVTQQLQGLKNYLDGLVAGPDSILKPEDQLALVQQQIAKAFALAQSGDASQGDVLAKLVQQALQLEKQINPEAGSAYRDMFTQLNLMLQQVWAMFQGPPKNPAAAELPGGGGGIPIFGNLPGPGVNPLVSGSGTGSQLVVSFLPVIQQMQLSTTMMQGSMGRVEDQARRGADASERIARATESNCSFYRKVS